MKHHPLLTVNHRPVLFCSQVESKRAVHIALKTQHSCTCCTAFVRPVHILIFLLFNSNGDKLPCQAGWRTSLHDHALQKETSWRSSRACCVETSTSNKGPTLTVYQPVLKDGEHRGPSHLSGGGVTIAMLHLSFQFQILAARRSTNAVRSQ